MALALILSLVIGLVLGSLGGGGSILSVPMLTYAVGMDVKHAIATSLLMVGATSAAAVVAHARSGLVCWRTGLVFGASGMAGAYLGGRVAAFIPGAILLAGFALVMLATGIAMLRSREVATASGADGKLHLATTITHGLAVGAVTGLIGAGGGFLVVPALALLGGMRMKEAVATSLLVIAMKSFAGFASLLPKLGILLGAGVLIGFGARVAGGCTSGHGIVGTALGSRSSLLATALFMLAGFATTQFVYWAAGG